jgi:hypothetical protein
MERASANGKIAGVAKASTVLTKSKDVGIFFLQVP